MPEPTLTPDEIRIGFERLDWWKDRPEKVISPHFLQFIDPELRAAWEKIADAFHEFKAVCDRLCPKS